MLYSLYILKQGADNKSRKREIGIATTNKDGSETLHFDMAIPTDGQGNQVKVFKRLNKVFCNLGLSSVE